MLLRLPVRDQCEQAVRTAQRHSASSVFAEKNLTRIEIQIQDPESERAFDPHLVQKVGAPDQLRRGVEEKGARLGKLYMQMQGNAQLPAAVPLTQVRAH